MSPEVRRLEKKDVLLAVGYEAELNGCDISAAADKVSKATGLDAQQIETVYNNATVNTSITHFCQLDNDIQEQITDLNRSIEHNQKIVNNDEAAIKNELKLRHVKTSKAEMDNYQTLFKTYFGAGSIAGQEVQLLAESFDNYIQVHNKSIEDSPFFDSLMKLCANLVEHFKTLVNPGARN